MEKLNQIKSFRIQEFLSSPQELTVQSENEDLRLQGGESRVEIVFNHQKDDGWMNHNYLIRPQ